MNYLTLTLVLTSGVAIIAGGAGLVFGIAGTILHFNKKASSPKIERLDKHTLKQQAILLSSSQTVRQK